VREERRRDQSCEKGVRKVGDAGVRKGGKEWCAYIQHEGQVL